MKKLMLILVTLVLTNCGRDHTTFENLNYQALDSSGRFINFHELDVNYNNGTTVLKGTYDLSTFVVQGKTVNCDGRFGDVNRINCFDSTDNSTTSYEKQ